MASAKEEHDLENGTVSVDKSNAAYEQHGSRKPTFDQEHLNSSVPGRHRSGSTRIQEWQNKMEVQTREWFGLSLRHWDKVHKRFTREGKAQVPWLTSFWNILTYSRESYDHLCYSTTYPLSSSFSVEHFDHLHSICMGISLSRRLGAFYNICL